MRRSDLIGFLLAVVLVAAVLAGWAVAASAQEQAQAAPEPRGFRAVVVITHGNSSNDESVRRIGWDIPERGYGDFYREFFPPLRELGFRRFAVWNPFGVNADEDMDADQAVEMAELLASLPGEQWRRKACLSPAAWTAAAVEQVTGHGDELIAYNGALDQDRDFVTLRGEPAAWMARAEASYRPYLDARASVAIDAGHDIRVNSLEHRWVEYLNARGAAVYLETYWLRTNGWTHTLPCIVHDRFYTGAIRDHPRGFTAIGWALPPEGVKAEVLRIVGHSAAETVEQRRARIKAIVADGHTPMIGAVDAAWYAQEVGW